MFRHNELVHTLGEMDPYNGRNEATVGSDIISLVFSPDATLLASGGAMARCSGDSACGDNDPSVRIWRVTDGAHLALYSGHSDGVTALDWSADGRTVVSGSQDGTVRLWDVTAVH